MAAAANSPRFAGCQTAPIAARRYFVIQISLRNREGVFTMDHVMTAHWIALGGRGLLALLFVLAGVTKLAGPKPVLAHMAQEHVPGFLLPVAAVFEIGAGAALAAGWNTLFAAGALSLFCVATALVFHRN